MKKIKSRKAEELTAYYCKYQAPIFSTTSYTRKEAIRKLENQFCNGAYWGDLRKRGYSVVKIKVTEVLPEAIYE